MIHLDPVPSTPHEEIDVLCPLDGTTVSVDVGIAGLLAAMWNHGCCTRFSCQGAEDKRAHVVFTDAESLERAMSMARDIALTGPDRSLPYRIAGLSSPVLALDGTVIVDYEASDCWTITAWTHLGFEDNFAVARKPPSPLLYRITFPAVDIATLVATGATGSRR